MCWEEVPSSTFNSTEAQRIGFELANNIEILNNESNKDAKKSNPLEGKGVEMDKWAINGYHWEFKCGTKSDTETIDWVKYEDVKALEEDNNVLKHKILELETMLSRIPEDIKNRHGILTLKANNDNTSQN